MRPDCCCPTKEFFGCSSRKIRQPTMWRLRNGQPSMDFSAKESFPSGDVRAPTTAPGCGLKTAIPERYIKPWEFKSTRDEALYDMNVRATFAGWFSSLTARLKSWIRGRGELKKWQFLLSGKSADDQLWAIPLPKGGVSHSSIRDWARKTLETARVRPAHDALRMGNLLAAQRALKIGGLADGGNILVSNT